MQTSAWIICTGYLSTNLSAAVLPTWNFKQRDQEEHTQTIICPRLADNPRLQGSQRDINDL